MKQKLKEFKRQLLKKIQARIRKFLNTEYRTPEEIQKDRMNSHVETLREACRSVFLGSEYLSGYVGEMTYTKDDSGKIYYRNHITGKWINIDDPEEITDDELKIRLGLETEVDQKLVKKLENAES